MDNIDAELRDLLARPSEKTVNELLNGFLDSPMKREAARLVLRIGDPAPGSALRRIGQLPSQQSDRELRAGILAAGQVAMMMIGLRHVIAGLETRIARGELDRPKAALLASEIRRFWRDLQPYRPLVNGLLKLMAKSAQADLAYRQLLDELDDRVFELEITAAKLRGS